MFAFVTLSVASDGVFTKKIAIAIPLLGVPRFEAESLSYVLLGRAAEKAAF
jgi:hypothetical protein